ncbi:MAG: LppX_LprAFG lipoprotein [Acidimicrobiales bacterium]
MRKVSLGAACVALALLATGCGGSPQVPAAKLLVSAQAALNATHGVHFVITSQNSGGGDAVTGGEGDLIRPAGLVGTFDLRLSGLPLTLAVKAEGERFYVKVPFSSSYVETSPSKYGIGNPAQFLSRPDGLSKILGVATDARVTGTTRLSGELLDEVSASVPGADIPVLSDYAPAKPVAMVAEIDPTSRQLRRVTLTGPFVVASTEATYVVTLTDYGDSASVNLPGS